MRNFFQKNNNIRLFFYKKQGIEFFTCKLLHNQQKDVFLQSVKKTHELKPPL